MGVGSKGGAEAAVHAVRQYLGRHAGSGGEVIALLDLKNAFNCVDRSAFRSAIRRIAPRLAPWVDYQYGEASPLFFGDTRLQSERGIQQGDPLGPALSAASEHAIIMELEGHLLELGLLELGLKVFYLDDGILAGDQETVAAAINFLGVKFAEIGLELNRSKCELVPTAGRDHRVDVSRFQGFEFKESGKTPRSRFRLLGVLLGPPESEMFKSQTSHDSDPGHGGRPNRAFAYAQLRGVLQGGVLYADGAADGACGSPGGLQRCH